MSSSESKHNKVLDVGKNTHAQEDRVSILAAGRSSRGRN